MSLIYYNVSIYFFLIHSYDKEATMFESAMILALYLTFALISYKTFLELKVSKQVRAQAKIKKPLYDYKGRLLKNYFY